MKRSYSSTKFFPKSAAVLAALSLLLAPAGATAMVVSPGLTAGAKAVPVPPVWQTAIGGLQSGLRGVQAPQISSVLPGLLYKNVTTPEQLSQVQQAVRSLEALGVKPEAVAHAAAQSDPEAALAKHVARGRIATRAKIAEISAEIAVGGEARDEANYYRAVDLMKLADAAGPLLDDRDRADIEAARVQAQTQYAGDRKATALARVAAWSAALAGTGMTLDDIGMHRALNTEPAVAFMAGGPIVSDLKSFGELPGAGQAKINAAPGKNGLAPAVKNSRAARAEKIARLKVVKAEKSSLEGQRARAFQEGLGVRMGGESIGAGSMETYARTERMFSEEAYARAIAPLDAEIRGIESYLSRPDVVKSIAADRARYEELKGQGRARPSDYRASHRASGEEYAARANEARDAEMAELQAALPRRSLGRWLNDTFTPKPGAGGVMVVNRDFVIAPAADAMPAPAVEKPAAPEKGGLEWKRAKFKAFAARMAPDARQGRGQLAGYLDAGDYARVRMYFIGRSLPGFVAQSGFIERMLYKIKAVRDSGWFRANTDLGRFLTEIEELDLPDSALAAEINGRLRALHGDMEVGEFTTAMKSFVAYVHGLVQDGKISPYYARFTFGESYKAIWPSALERDAQMGLSRWVGENMNRYGSSVPAFNDLI